MRIFYQVKNKMYFCKIIFIFYLGFFYDNVHESIHIKICILLQHFYQIKKMKFLFFMVAMTVHRGNMFNFFKTQIGNDNHAYKSQNINISMFKICFRNYISFDFRLYLSTCKSNFGFR